MTRSFTFGNTDESKILHLVPITFQAGENSGKISQKIRFVTDLNDSATIDLKAIGQVGAPLAGN